MHNCYRALLTLFFVVTAFGSQADSQTFKATTNAGAQRPDSSQNGHNKPQPPNCTQPNADPRCRHPRPPTYYPDRYPYDSRPVIVNQLPPEPAIEINSLTDDWDGCHKAKLGAIQARNSGRADEANSLDEWLWKNCRSYSNELRQLEQDDM